MGWEKKKEKEISANIGFLGSLGLPPGISRELLHACTAFPLRIFIIDNSGSMQIPDGHRLVAGMLGRERLVPCSRWEELTDALQWHANLASGIGAPTEFRLLNETYGAQP